MQNVPFNRKFQVSELSLAPKNPCGWARIFTKFQRIGILQWQIEIKLQTIVQIIANFLLYYIYLYILLKCDKNKHVSAKNVVFNFQ